MFFFLFFIFYFLCVWCVCMWCGYEVCVCVRGDISFYILPSCCCDPHSLPEAYNDMDEGWGQLHT